MTTGDTSVNGSDTVYSVLTTESTISTLHAGIYQCRANLTSNTTVVMSSTVTLNIQSKLLEFCTCNNIDVNLLQHLKQNNFNRLNVFIIISTHLLK